MSGVGRAGVAASIQGAAIAASYFGAPFLREQMLAEHPNLSRFTNIHFFLLLLTVASCKPKENMVYLETDRSMAEEQVRQAVFEGSRLQSGDFSHAFLHVVFACIR